VRRLLAIVLLSVVNAAAIAPALFAQTALPLPPCCRNTGKHKCALRAQTGTAQTSDSSIRTVAERCPFPSASGSLTANSPASLARPAHPESGAALPALARLAYFVALPCLAFTHTPLQRGPPVLSA